MDEEDSDDPDLKEKKEPNWIEKWVDENGFVKVRKTWSKPDRTFAKETYSPRDASWIENGFGGLHSADHRKYELLPKMDALQPCKVYS